MIQKRHPKGNTRIASAIIIVVMGLVAHFAIKTQNSLSPEPNAPISNEWETEAKMPPGKSPTEPEGQPQQTAGYPKFWTGIPKKEGLELIGRSGHINGFDPAMMSPAWTGYIVFKQDNPTSAERPGEFQPDTSLRPEWQVDPAEYTRSGYDRGHMAPNWAVSINFGRVAQVETFYMSNIAPQTPELNRGIWASIEKVIANDYARRYGEVIVFVGPLFNEGPAKAKGIGKNNRIKIPDGFYKIIVRDRKNPQAIALMLPQNPTAKRMEDLSENLVTIRELETHTGIDFLPGLPQDVQDKVETTRAKRMW